MKNKIKILIVIIIISIPIGISAQSSSRSNSTWYAPKSANTIENPLKNDGNSIKKGKKMFNQLCSVCHGFNGKGDGIAGSALIPKPANFTTKTFQSQTDGAIFWKLAEGRTPMASYKDIISEKERWDLVNYMRTLNKN